MDLCRDDVSVDRLREALGCDADRMDTFLLVVGFGFYFELRPNNRVRMPFEAEAFLVGLDRNAVMYFPATQYPGFDQFLAALRREAVRECLECAL